ncbi:MAG: class I SAM-dependent methyltransferase [Chryseobacterium sp.]
MNRSTKDADYTERLSRLSGAQWKQLLDVQRPYRWNVKRLNLGATLDIGCGIGRHLGHLPKSSVGVDHNKDSIRIARKSGYVAYTTNEFFKKKIPKETFDSMLLAHVLEHMSTSQGKKIIKDYLPYVKSNIVVICPQEKGFPTDETHVNFLSHADIEQILKSLGLVIRKSYSFPFHKQAGKVFTHNETIVVACKA